jgi:hypothetical protein
VETQNGASKTMCEIDDKDRLEKQFISSQSFHRTTGGRVREITAGERFEPQTLESFDPLTQESKPGFTCNNSNHSINTIEELEGTNTATSNLRHNLLTMGSSTEELTS